MGEPTAKFWLTKAEFEALDLAGQCPKSGCVVEIDHALATKLAHYHSGSAQGHYWHGVEAVLSVQDRSRESRILESQRPI